MKVLGSLWVGGQPTNELRWNFNPGAFQSVWRIFRASRVANYLEFCFPQFTVIVLASQLDKLSARISPIRRVGRAPVARGYRRAVPSWLKLNRQAKRNVLGSRGEKTVGRWSAIRKLIKQVEVNWRNRRVTRRAVAWISARVQFGAGLPLIKGSLITDC